MAFHADLHVHSKHSRATSRDLDLEHLAWWAARKGIGVVGTGDCVHPGWLAELKDKLTPAGGGLFRLKPEIEAEVMRTLPPSCRRPVSFMLSTEISTIYKKGEKTRKVHHLIYAPDFDTADRLAASLARIGNIASDGRPILGLDSRDLLEIALESGPDAYLVPAHIWTPWFAALGSQSGFDSIAECYGDLAPHIFAVETGLSSDPSMNWRVSFLDRYRLTSNSDAHSPGKLGREATRFGCEPDYFAIRRALETGEGYLGTVEFFPEEGKYHLDGHRNCRVRLEPTETLARGGLCPVCGSKVTVGVAHRIEMLADRKEAEVVPPATAGEVDSLVPLPEILSEIVGSGVASNAVNRTYDRAVAALGPELALLGEVPVEDIARTDTLLAEAVERLRSGAVIREAGYDGEYGVIRLFEEGELSRRSRGELLFDAPVRRKAKQVAARPEVQAPPAPAAAQPLRLEADGILDGLDEDQRRAAELVDGPVVVLAGPGSGKTRMLTRRLAHLIVERGVLSEACLAVTFTRRATEELRQRLRALLPVGVPLCPVHSFHSLGLTILRRHAAALGLPAEFRIADEAERVAALAEAMGVTKARAARLVAAVSLAKRTSATAEGDAAEAGAVLKRLGKEQGWIDLDDLVDLAVELLEADAAVATAWRQRFRHVCVDELQDIDRRQYRLIELLAAPDGNLCVIGDPDQAIYGFRGADAAAFAKLAASFPTVRTVRLGRNYRSTGSIAGAAAGLVRGAADTVRPMGEPVVLRTAASEAEEAELVASTIERLLGGHDLLVAGEAASPLGYGDFAVLYRSDAQSAALREALDRAGIPFAKSTPAPITDRPAVRALLDRIDRAEGDSLADRIAEAAEALRLDGTDAAAIAEARQWITSIAASDAAQLREQAAMATEADFHDPRADRVSLLTMHAAKGLEFPVVFVVGLEDGLMPLRFGGERDGEGEAEERRLLYVAMTRAEDRLFLSRALKRAWRGAVRELPPSPFLRDLPASLLVQERAAPARARAQQLRLI
ncbi:MAG TPA: UvrD-helicase domain-containing protein [Geminicoccaceae bacterium]|nr:UvrD-helicase domain-containing protein [Geminicoccus sp.]HMU50154.1 UvrD-helicase domain-containing protein [Geminicoccaceae bacterium]